MFWGAIDGHYLPWIYPASRPRAYPLVLAGDVDQLGLVEAIDGLCQGVVVAVPVLPTDGSISQA